MGPSSDLSHNLLGHATANWYRPRHLAFSESANFRNRLPTGIGANKQILESGRRRLKRRLPAPKGVSRRHQKLNRACFGKPLMVFCWNRPRSGERGKRIWAERIRSVQSGLSKAKPAFLRQQLERTLHPLYNRLRRSGGPEEARKRLAGLLPRLERLFIAASKKGRGRVKNRSFEAFWLPQTSCQQG